MTVPDKRACIYPGTFDPLTNGHLDLINRALHIFDQVIVTIAVNPDKTPLFTVEERLEMITDAVLLADQIPRAGNRPDRDA